MGEQTLAIYRTSTPVFDTTYDLSSDEPPTKAIVDAVAAAADQSPVRLPPLYEYVDVDAITTMLEHEETASNPGTTLGFTIDDWEVFIRADGRIRVCDSTQPTTPQPVFDES